MADFRWSWKTIALPLKHSFGISRGSRTKARDVFLRLEFDGLTGYGEAAPNARYNETPQQVEAYFKKALEIITSPPAALPQIEALLDSIEPEVRSGRAALEMALLDLWAKQQDQALYKLLQSPSATGPVTTMTIGLDKPEILRQKVREARDYPILKVKLDGQTDREVLKTIRSETDKEIRVDVNEGWTDWEQAVAGLRMLESYGVSMIEQPMPAAQLDMIRQLHKETRLPFIADESVILDESMEELAGAFDVINIKLMKTGGILRSLRLLERAREEGLEIMVGCMVESSLADAASLQVGVRADYADLDGHLLLSKDPFEGLIDQKDGRIRLSNAPGLGIKPLPHFPLV